MKIGCAGLQTTVKLLCFGDSYGDRICSPISVRVGGSCPLALRESWGDRGRVPHDITGPLADARGSEGARVVSTCQTILPVTSVVLRVYQA